jgi:hypothetical protein
MIIKFLLWKRYFFRKNSGAPSGKEPKAPNNNATSRELQRISPPEGAGIPSRGIEVTNYHND